MPYGMYVSGEGATAQSHRIEVLAHNLANVDTPGFKRELAVLQTRHSEAIQRGEDYPGSRSINDIGGGVALTRTTTHFAQGPVVDTGIPTDMAIDGEGFFVIEKDGRQMLTRAGNFQFNAAGRLVTQDGSPVLAGDGRPIDIDPTRPWQLSASGAVSQSGSSFPLALVKPASLGDLVRAGENLFEPLADTIPLSSEQRSVRGGCLEMSGVKPTTELVDMIQASRAFEANIRMIQSQDQMIGALVNRALRSV